MPGTGDDPLLFRFLNEVGIIDQLARARLEGVLDAYLQGSGVIDSRNEGLNRQSRDLDTRMEAMNYRLTLIEGRLLDQFGALDTLVANMQTTGSFLSMQLNALPGVS